MKTLLSILLLSGLTVWADTNLIPFLSVQNGKAVLSIQASNGVGNFRITGSTVTATNPPALAAVATNEWIASETLGTVRTNYTGFIGVFLTNSSASIVALDALGVMVGATNSATIGLALMRMSDYVWVATVDADLSGVSAGSYAWGSTNVTLEAGGTYALIRSVYEGVDQFWDNNTTVTTQGPVTQGLSCYMVNFYDVPLADVDGVFGPVNLRYQ